MPAANGLYGDPGRLSGANGGEAAECGGSGAMATGSGTCDDDGASNGVPIVNKSWGSTQLRGVGFMVYTF